MRSCGPFHIGARESDTKEALPLLFRWFISMETDGGVWNQAAFNKNNLTFAPPACVSFGELLAQPIENRPSAAQAR